MKELDMSSLKVGDSIKLRGLFTKLSKTAIIATVAAKAPDRATFKLTYHGIPIGKLHATKHSDNEWIFES